MLITGIRWVCQIKVEGHLSNLGLSEFKFDLVLFIMIIGSKDRDKDSEKNIRSERLERGTLREHFRLSFPQSVR